MKGGATWEFQLERWHNNYRRDRVGVIFRCHPAVRMLSKPAGGRFLACYESTGPPDFVGFIHGRGVTFDAKEVRSGQRLVLNRIEPHQAQDLEAAFIQGNVAFICARFVRHNHTIVFPWVEIREKYFNKVPSILANEGKPFGEGGWMEVWDKIS